MGAPPARRAALPAPKQKDENSSLWSIMWSILKESLGKDLTHITLPFFFNEPLSVLQKSMEDLEYADLLNKASTASKLFCRLHCIQTADMLYYIDNRQRLAYQQIERHYSAL